MNQILTDEELRDICLENQGDNQRCRAIESAVMAKLREQEPFRWIHIDKHGATWLYEPDEERAEGSIPLYLNPAPIPEVEAENARLQGYCETIDKLRAMDQEACNKAWIEIERLRDLLKEARSNLYDMCDAAIVYRIDEALKGQQ